MGQSVSRAVEGSVLGEAAANNEIEVISQIVDTYPRALLYKTLFKRRTPLMLAAEHGAVESLLKLLWAAERLLGGAGYQQYLDERDGKGYTALSLAVKRGHSVCARLLLEDSADPLLANSRGDTALHLAAGGGHAACVDMLLRAWVRNRGSGTTGRAADAMVSDGVGEERYVDTHNRSGLAPLHLAVLGGSVEAAAVLIRGGASPDVPVLRGLQLRMPFLCGGSTPLHIAAFQGNARMCLVLLEGQWRHPGVELRRLRNARGLTPLNCALLAGHHDLARLLVESRLPSPVLSISRRALDYQFPEPLRQHLLGILHRAGLLVQLREISKSWKAQGLAKPTDDSVKMVGLAELRPGALTRLTQLVQREGSSLRDIIAGLEEAFAPAQQAQRQRGGAAPELHQRGPAGEQQQGQQRPQQLGAAAAAAAAARGPAGSPAAAPLAAAVAADASPPPAGARASVASLAASVSSAAAAASVAGATAGSFSSSRAVAGQDGAAWTASEGSSDGDGGSSRGGGRRRRGLGRSARRRGSRRTEPTTDSAAGPSVRSAGLGAGASASRDVDWTILEAQRMLSLDPWGMALSRRRTRGRRSGRRGATEGSDPLPQTVLEVQQSGAGVMPPHRRRQRSRESRQLVLSELIESLHSVEGVLSSSAGAAAERPASPHAGSGGPDEHGGPLTQQAEQAQHGTLHGGSPAPREPGEASGGAAISSGTSGGRSTAGGSHRSGSEGPGSTGEPEDQASAAGRAAESQGPVECAICFDSTCDVMVGGCGHGICFVCACKMVARSNEPCCPFCRGPIHEFKQLAGARRQPVDDAAT